MITLVTEIIRKNPHWLKKSGTEFSFMKVCTPASGKELNSGKVLIFVFEDRERYPTLCVKTTRTHESGEIVKRNFANLKLVTDSAMNTDSKPLFAQPLYMHDDNKIIFSVESACPGEMFSSQHKNIDLVFDKYMQWQELLAENPRRLLRIQDLNKIALDLIKVLPISIQAMQTLENYYNGLGLDPATELPELLQHGDMTPDNVLICGCDVYLIDYDYVGLSRIPGFDLFHFLSKTRRRVGTLYENCEKYLPKYFNHVRGHVPALFPILFIYYLQESVRKGIGQKGAEEIIGDFESLLERP